MPPRRLRRLPRLHLAGGGCLYVARSPLARLLGLAWLRTPPPPGTALLVDRCRSVHTFGMRFALDLDFVDSRGRVVKRVRGLPPGRVAGCRAAVAVVERPSV